MKLNTGKVAFSIEFDNGDKQNIYFNPNDPDLSIRMRDFEKKINARIEEIDDVKLKADGTPEDLELIEQFRQIRNVLYEELDYAFGSKISATVFKHCSPFAIVEGNYFILLFLEAIKPEIEMKIKKSKAEAEAKLNKHIAKYAKQ